MHIAYVTDQVLPQTATDTEQLVSMCAALADYDIKVDLITPSHYLKKSASVYEIADYYDVNPSFELETVKGMTPSFRGLEKVVHAIVSAFKIRKRDEVDFVYTRNLPIVIASLFFSDKKVIYENYRPWPDQNKFMLFLFKWFLKNERFSGLVLHSELAAKSYYKIGYKKERVLVAHNGVALDRFEKHLSLEDAKKKLGWNNNKTIITYTGRVNKDKGLDIMLALAKEFPDVQFMIVGSEGEGIIENMAKPLQNVKVFPWQQVDEIPLFLQASDMLFIPPTAKPLKEVGNTVLPMKTFIYLAAGRVIIAPHTPDIEEILEHGKDALLVNPDDFDDLKFKLKKALEGKENVDQLGENAKYKSMKYTWSGRAEKVKSFLQRLV